MKSLYGGLFGIIFLNFVIVGIFEIWVSGKIKRKTDFHQVS